MTKNLRSKNPKTTELGLGFSNLNVRQRCLVYNTQCALVKVKDWVFPTRKGPLALCIKVTLLKKSCFSMPYNILKRVFPKGARSKMYRPACAYFMKGLDNEIPDVHSWRHSKTFQQFESFEFCNSSIEQNEVSCYLLQQHLFVKLQNMVT